MLKETTKAAATKMENLGSGSSLLQKGASIIDRKIKELDGVFLDGGCSEMTIPLLDKVSAGDDAQILIAKKEKPIVKQELGWSKKYQPKALEDFICHREKAEMLLCMVRGGQFNHCIIEGPPGIGKRTMALALLREALGLDITETREEVKVFNLKGASKGEQTTSIYIKVRLSSQHIEVNLSELKGNVADVLMELLKETHTTILYQQNLQHDHNNVKAIVLYPAEILSKDAQLHIQGFLQACKGHYKVVLCCCNVNKFQFLKSLCIVVQLLPPSNQEIVEVLDFIAKQEDIQLPHQVAKRIAKNSKQCLQQAIRSFEATWQSNYPFKEDQLIMTGWEEELAKIARSIIQKQSAEQLFTVRQKLIILLMHNVCPGFIFSSLVGELKKHVDDQFQLQLEILYQDYNATLYGDPLYGGKNSSNGKEVPDQRMRKGFLAIMTIEEFVAKFMSSYKGCYWKNRKG